MVVFSYNIYNKKFWATPTKITDTNITIREQKNATLVFINTILLELVPYNKSQVLKNGIHTEGKNSLIISGEKTRNP